MKVKKHLAKISLPFATLSAMAALVGIAVLFGCRVPGRDRNAVHARVQHATSTTLACPLDGQPARAEYLQRRTLAVMIENSPRSRPQSGLLDACVVYEAITEGGITRFLAIYLHGSPSVIGPVRSARPHFIDILREYRSGFVHCGQSFEALQILTQDPSIYNIDQMLYPKPFWRDRSRQAPHNLYTSSARVHRLLQTYHCDMPESPLPGFVNPNSPMSGQPATTIDLRFPGAVQYRLRLVYDKNVGGYLRYMDGKLHVDRETRKAVVVSNVVIQRVYAQPYEKSTKGTMDVEMVGSGFGMFFSRGQQLPLQWIKMNAHAMTSFRDMRDRPLPFQAGQTWIEIVPVDGSVTIDGVST